MEAAPRSSTILIVVSHDFGELGYAYDFAWPLLSSSNVIFALPPHLYRSNGQLAEFNSVPYESDADIMALYRGLDPDCLLLFAAWLLVPNRIFSMRSLRSFIADAVQKNRLVVTSDPFLGFTASVTMRDIRPHATRQARIPGHDLYLKYLTRRQYRQMHALLADLPRLCPFGIDHLETRRQGYVYFNAMQADTSESVGENPYWLFVISEIDYMLQTQALGQEKFEGQLVNKLLETSALGRRPLLLAPHALIARMKPLAPSLDYVHHCDVLEHKVLVTGAERVFYWNMISHSIYHRMTRLQPLHFFARGHICSMFPRLHQLAMRSYYDGTEPDIIDFAGPLATEQLAASNERFYEIHRSRLQGLQQFPGAAALLQQLYQEKEREHSPRAR